VDTSPQHWLAAVDDFFMGRSPVQHAALRLARIFDDMGIVYAVAGALAMFAHGRRRMTEDVDMVVTRDDLARFKAQWLGRGYVELRSGGKAIREAATGVRIDFLLSGDFPGDGQPKAIAFPVPQPDYPVVDGLRVVPMNLSIEMKLASGMTAAHRGQDLVDVMALVKARSLPRDHAEQLDAFVREAFERQWELAQHDDDY
jgi:hypothetical protein